MIAGYHDIKWLKMIIVFLVSQDFSKILMINSINLTLNTIN